MRGLFIGRFQPFHLGHLEAVKWILSQVDELVIAIGSANVALTFRNPFTVGERIEMIVRTLKAEGLIDRVYICSVPDTGNMHSIWPAHLKHWCPHFDVVYTNDALTQLCLEYANVPYRTIPFFKREEYSGTRIRVLMAVGDEEWRKLVHREVSRFIDRINGVERIRKLARIENIIATSQS